MTAPEDPNGLRQTLAPCVTEALAEFQKRYGYHRPVIEELLTDFGEIVAGIAAADLASLRAAEAEITRLKEGMEALKKPAGPVYAAAYDQGRGPDDEDDWMLCDRNGRCIARMLDRCTAEIIAREWNQDLATLSPKDQP
jgi:hypothetical protein